MLIRWINLVCVVAALTACSTNVKKVTNPNAPTMEQVFNEYTGVDEKELEERKRLLLQRPALNVETQLPVNPFPDQLEHLYPRLPNPDLFMYVRPHAVGSTGAPIPAYVTRFTMYERQPYALPGETLPALKIDNDYRIHEHQRELQEAEKRKRNTPANPSLTGEDYDGR
jgi:conjugative transfer region lipoprotein (TIGR03751 family)